MKVTGVNMWTNYYFRLFLSYYMYSTGNVTTEHFQKCDLQGYNISSV